MRIRLTRLARIVGKLEKIAEEVQADEPQAALALDIISDALEGRVAFKVPEKLKKVFEDLKNVLETSATIPDSATKEFAEFQQHLLEEKADVMAGNGQASVAEAVREWFKKYMGKLGPDEKKRVEDDLKQMQILTPSGWKSTMQVQA